MRVPEYRLQDGNFYKTYHELTQIIHINSFYSNY
jgi:hypothetical protein